MYRAASLLALLAAPTGASEDAGWEGHHVAEHDHDELRSGLPCPSGPRELEALWQAASYDPAVRPHAHPGAAAGVGVGAGDGWGPGVPTQAWATVFLKVVGSVDTKEE